MQATGKSNLNKKTHSLRNCQDKNFEKKSVKLEIQSKIRSRLILQNIGGKKELGTQFSHIVFIINAMNDKTRT